MIHRQPDIWHVCCCWLFATAAYPWCICPCVLQYHNRLCDYLNTYDKAFIVHADNVGSKQMSDIRAVSYSWRSFDRQRSWQKLSS